MHCEKVCSELGTHLTTKQGCGRTQKTMLNRFRVGCPCSSLKSLNGFAKCNKCEIIFSFPQLVKLSDGTFLRFPCARSWPSLSPNVRSQTPVKFLEQAVPHNLQTLDKL